MIDQLLHFENEENINVPFQHPCTLVDGVTYMPVSVVVTEASHDGQQPVELAPGFWVAVASPSGISHPNLVEWLSVSGRVTPVFAGREFPTE